MEDKLWSAKVSKWFIMKTDKKPDQHYHKFLMLLEGRSVGFLTSFTCLIGLAF
jgi:hypothetical protein